jgi:hypothetical protein
VDAALKGDFARVYEDRRFIGIGKCEGDVLKPRKVLELL